MVHRVRQIVPKGLAALLALSIAGTSFAVVPAAADSCCCGHVRERCHCPVCEHARQIESGLRHIQPCAQPHVAAGLHRAPDVLPPVIVSEAIRPAIAPPDRPLFSPAEAPAIEVRTPPPLP